MNGVKKTAPTVSEAVKQYMEENSVEIDSFSANLIREKIFTDKKEYTLEFYKRVRPEFRPEPPDEKDIEFAKSVLAKLLSLMKFINFEITTCRENDITVLRISTQNKDGLLIGKNGQNLIALQYLMSIITDKKLKKHLPLIIDVDSYRAKRAMENNSEVITDFLPSYERKLVHQEITSIDSLKTFSIGKGSYKKVVITSLL